jgi:probable F420-dependent oxidoreductase
MQLGMKFPTRELGNDTGLIREFASLTAELGFRFVHFSEHVLGADPKARSDFDKQHPTRENPYTFRVPWHEPMVTMGFFAALTDLDLQTILVAPQRQTALVAKQAAEVAVLANGSVRFICGVGWNPVEYEALGQNFKTRGRRLNEQLPLLRELFAKPIVNFEGEFDRIVGAGISPLPGDKTPALWVAGGSEHACRRAGLLGDGWRALNDGNFDNAKRGIEIVKETAIGAGRDPASVGIDVPVPIKEGPGFGDLAGRVEQWRACGATLATIDVMDAGLAPRELLDTMCQLVDYLPLKDRS